MRLLGATTQGEATVSAGSAVHTRLFMLAGRGTGAESAPARGRARMWKRPHLFGGRALARSLAGRHAGKTASTGSAYARFESGRLRTLPLAKLFAAISMDGWRRDGHVGRTSATKKTTAGSCDREGRVVRIFTHTIISIWQLLKDGKVE